MTPPDDPPGAAPPSTGIPRFSTGRLAAWGTALLWTLAWGAANLAWLARDHLLRDGDEEGHVGAAELFRWDLAQGDPAAFLARLWTGDMGDYPSLHAALVGGWWWLTGESDPGHLAVRALGLLWVLIAAAACGRIAGRISPTAGLAAFLAATLLPLPVGLGRHFMPEGLLVAAVAVAVLAALRLAERPLPRRAVALGLALGLGLLVKQTFVLLAGPAVLVALLSGTRRRRTLAVGTLAALPALVVAGPWYLGHLDAQLSYGTASVAGAGDAGLLAHAAFYPAAAVLLVVGPPLSALALGGLVAGLRDPGPRRRIVLLAAGWLLGALLLLSLLPKKYPRLLAPAAPAAAVLAAAALPRRSRFLPAGAGPVLIGAAGASWLVLRSTTAPAPLPAPLQAVVPGCPQHWVRAPVDDDLGLAEVLAALSERGRGPVLLRGSPEIPCAIQTSPPWGSHLGPALRRTGQDRELVEVPGEGEEETGGAARRWDAVVTWHEPADEATAAQAARGGVVVQVPALGGAFLVQP